MGYTEIMEKKMETTVLLGLCWGYIGIMEQNMSLVIGGLFGSEDGRLSQAGKLRWCKDG